VIKQKLSAKEQAWLLYPRSLTARLKANCREFHIDVLKQYYRLATHQEAHLLSIMARSRVWVREVVLWADEQAMIVARSVIPCTTLTGKEQRLCYLGEKSLGGYLFTHRAWHREPFVISKVSLQQFLEEPYPRYAFPMQQHLWARRSVSFLSAKPLLLTEVFLPAVFQLP